MHLSRQRWLRDREPPRGLSDAAFVDDSQKVAKVPELQGPQRAHITCELVSLASLVRRGDGLARARRHVLARLTRLAPLSRKREERVPHRADDRWQLAAFRDYMQRNRR